MIPPGLCPLNSFPRKAEGSRRRGEGGSAHGELRTWPGGDHHMSDQQCRQNSAINEGLLGRKMRQFGSKLFD